MCGYRVRVKASEFRNYLVEADSPWGDNYFDQVFGGDIDSSDGCIEIEYKYGKFVNCTGVIKWRVIGTNKTYKLSYGGISEFAVWWGQLTDDLEN